VSERLGLHRALTGDDAEQGLLNHIDSRGIGVVSSMGSVRLDEERPFGLGLTAAAATSSKPTCSCASAVLSSGSATADTAGLASSCHLLRGRGPSGVLDGVRLITALALETPALSNLVQPLRNRFGRVRRTRTSDESFGVLVRAPKARRER